MAYITKTFRQDEAKKAFLVLIEKLQINISEAQKSIDRKRVFVDGILLEDKNIEIKGNIEVVLFEPAPTGLQPVFQNEDFAVFEKPSGLLVHPRRREDTTTLNDDIKYLYGKDANVVHRIDKETSGLILVSKNKANETPLKELFENKKVFKEYVALVRGHLCSHLEIEAKLLVDLPSSLIRLKSHVGPEGKTAFTIIEPLQYDENNNVTLVRAVPKTGRQHQIRAHLFHVKHPIIGDTLYGVDEKFADRYLTDLVDESERLRTTQAKRLLLHANRIAFEYKNIKYDIVSKIDIQKEFYANCQFEQS